MTTGSGVPVCTFDNATSALEIRPVVVSAGLLEMVGNTAAAECSVEGALSVLEKLTEELPEWSDDQSRVTVAEAGGVDFTLVSLRRHPQDEQVQKLACLAMRRLSFIRESSNAFADGHAVPLVLRAMDGHLGNAEIQAHACSSLMNMATNGGNEVASAIRQAGGVEQGMAALRRHPRHAFVLRGGCGLLCALSVNAAGQRAVLSLGGLEIVVAALRRLPNHFGVQLAGLLALQNLSNVPQPPPAAACPGILQVTLGAMQRWKEDASILDVCCDILRFFLDDADEYVTTVSAFRADIVRCVIGGLEEHVANAEMQLSGLDLLGCLLTHHPNANDRDDGKWTIAARGGLEAILAALQAHPNGEEILQVGWEVLGYLVEDSPFLRRYLLSLPILPVVEGALQRHSQSHGVEVAGRMLLMQLDWNNSHTF